MKKNELNKIGSLLNVYNNTTGNDLTDTIIDVTNVFELANAIEKIAEINDDTARAINTQLVNILDLAEKDDYVWIDFRNYLVEDVFKLIMTYYRYHQSLTA